MTGHPSYSELGSRSVARGWLCNRSRFDHQGSSKNMRDVVDRGRNPEAGRRKCLGGLSASWLFTILFPSQSQLRILLLRNSLRACGRSTAFLLDFDNSESIEKCHQNVRSDADQQWVRTFSLVSQRAHSVKTVVCSLNPPHASFLYCLLYSSAGVYFHLNSAVQLSSRSANGAFICACTLFRFLCQSAGKEGQSQDITMMRRLFICFVLQSSSALTNPRPNA